MSRTDSVGGHLVRLGRSGVEVAGAEGQPDMVRHRPRELAPDVAACLAACKARLVTILRDGYQPTGDAREVFLERLGVADELLMPTHTGSPAWLIAVGEALSVGTSARSLDALCDLASRHFGAHVESRLDRFDPITGNDRFESLRSGGRP